MNQVLNTLIISANAALVALLFWRRIYRTLAAFTLLICYWLLLELAFSAFDHLPALLEPYPRFFDFLSLIGDAILIAVLSELTWRAFCSSTLFVTPPSPLIVVIFIILLGWSMWPFIALLPPRNPMVRASTLLHLRMEQTLAVLTLFVALAIHLANRTRPEFNVDAEKSDQDPTSRHKKRSYEWLAASGLAVLTLTIFQEFLSLSTYSAYRLASCSITIGVLVYWIFHFGRQSYGATAAHLADS